MDPTRPLRNFGRDSQFMRSALRVNTIANFAGQTSIGLLNLAVIPFYLQYLGTEVYGLLGFLLSLQSLVHVLDMGLSTTANRQLALDSVRGEESGEPKVFLRTLELVYGTSSILIAAGFFLASSWIATVWIKSSQLSGDTIALAILLFGLSLALRWPVFLYQGVLRGTERQVLANAIAAAIAAAKNLGGIVIVAFVSQSVVSLLVWHLGTALLELAVMALAAWRSIPRVSARPATFDPKILVQVWRFSVSLGLISVFSAVIKQLDKVLVVALLPLEQAGFYMVASTIAAYIPLLAAPVFNAAFPRFTSLLSTGKVIVLSEAYHTTTRVVSLVVAPVASILILFPREILFLWTRSPQVSDNAGTALSILALAGMLNATMHISFALQLAAGITWIALWNNGVSLLILLPFFYFGILQYGVAGGGLAWLLFNIVYFAVTPHIVHRYVLPGQQWTWILVDTVPFAILSMVVFGGVRSIAGPQISQPWLLALLVSGTLCYVVIGALLMRTARRPSWAL